MHIKIRSATKNKSSKQIHRKVNRFSSKEATYKALFPRYRIGWTDLMVFKDDEAMKPRIRFSDEWKVNNGSKEKESPDRIAGEEVNTENQSFSSNSSSSQNSSSKLVAQKSQVESPTIPRNPSLSTSGESSTDLPRIHLSISHDGDYVIAYVVAERI